MYNFLFVLQIIIATLLILLILVQRTGTDGLSGLAGGSSNFGVAPKRRKGDLLTKTTMILAVLFMLNSIMIARVFIGEFQDSKKITEGIDEKAQDIQRVNPGNKDMAPLTQVPRA